MNLAQRRVLDAVSRGYDASTREGRVLLEEHREWMRVMDEAEAEKEQREKRAREDA